jgi:hypothetical protein
MKPLDLKWKFERYSNPELSLIPSDLDRLKNTLFTIKGEHNEINSCLFYHLKRLSVSQANFDHQFCFLIGEILQMALFLHS